MIRRIQILISTMMLAFLLPLFPLKVKCQTEAVKIRQFTLENTIHLQGVAVGENFFYAINNFSITKHRKSDGAMVAGWDGSKDGIIRHLNSGVVLKNKLYCANSNFPDTPMASSIEIFDTRSMKHIGNHSFGIFAGSATWVDRKDGYWWVVFANYNGKHSFEGRDNRWTRLVKFNDDWNEMESWIFPKEVLEAFAPYSNSGGSWSKKGTLYVTGHDKKEIYIIKLPDIGYTLQLVKKIPVINPGQAIAIDRYEKNREIFYAVNRAENAVVVEEIK